MKRFFIFILVVFTCQQSIAQVKTIADNAEFNGYIQVRGISSNNYSSFSLRRLKLWIKSKHGFSKHWSYKIQTTFTSFQQEKFFLQDIKIGYKTGSFSFDIGQFIPQYSLQRFQPDYKLPSIERNKVINVLIPDGTLGIRDLGIQVNYTTENKFFETHLGLFNGYGIKEYRFNNQGYMITHKSELNILADKDKIKLGYSIQYRYAENLQLLFIFPDTVSYSGSDLRYNLFAIYKSKLFKFQAEYLTADFNGQRASGYYIFSAINYRKNQLVFSYEVYNDLIEETFDRPYYRLGYNYLIKDYKIKLSIDNYFQLKGHKIEKYFASIQLQIFLI